MAVVVYGQRVLGERPRNNEDPTPDWLLTSILRQMTRDEKRYKRLRQYVEGDPPKPETPTAIKEDSWAEFELFRRKARTNFAELVVDACVDRTHLEGFRTAAAGDEDGDTRAEQLWEENNLDLISDKVHSDAYTYGSGFLAIDTETKRAKQFRPWQAMVVRDSVGDPVVGVAIEHNAMQARDYAYLWMRDVDDNGLGTGTVDLHIAVRDREQKHYEGTFNTEVPLGTQVNQRWVWWKTVDTKEEVLPLYWFENREGVGEFERHTDVLDRINHMLLQRVVIATMQAFKQRALKGEFPERDKDGNKIDWNAMFPADPGALWLLPPEADIWESTQSSLQDILASVKDDVRDLAAVTRTPMTYFTPDSANGSAEGASLQREGYTSKVNDRKKRFGAVWRKFMAALFRVNDEAERADVHQIDIQWTPTEQLALSERFSAFSQASNGQALPLRTLMREVLHFTPKQMRMAELERISQTLTSALGAPPTNGGEQSKPAETPLGRSRNANAQLAKTNGATSRNTGVSSS